MAAPIKQLSGFIPALCRSFSASCHVNLPQKLSPTLNHVKHYSIAQTNNRILLPICSPIVQTVRTGMHWDWLTIRCNKTEGKPESNEDVLKRFYRLNCGLWIRTKAGRNKRNWKKSSEKKYRQRQHVICNAQQSNLLDKMVTSEWKKKTYFVDDPYGPYQNRTGMEHKGFNIKKPKFIP